MKYFLIFICSLLGLILVGLTIFKNSHTINYVPQEIISPNRPHDERKIKFTDQKEPLLAILGPNQAKDNPEIFERRGENKPSSSSPSSNYEKGITRVSQLAINSDLLSAGISSKDISHLNQQETEEFLKKLEEVFKRGDTDDGNGSAQEIFFSTIMPDQKTGLPWTTDYLSPRSLRIFAMFSSSTDSFRDLDRVLVKWFNPKGQIVMFQYLGITPNANYNYIWKEMNYWSPGIYNVEIYKLGKEIEILASGSYFVQDLNEYFGYTGLYVDLNQPISQTDFLKNEFIYLKLNHHTQKEYQLTLILKTFNGGITVMAKNIVVLPRSQNSISLIKGHPEFLLPGTYWLELGTKDGFLVGRTKFTIN